MAQGVVASLLRIALASAIAIVAWAAITCLLLLLPPPCAVATTFAGLILFLVGAKLHWRWPTVVGGVVMFAGVFAPALLGVLGPGAH